MLGQVRGSRVLRRGMDLVESEPISHAGANRVKSEMKSHRLAAARTDGTQSAATQPDAENGNQSQHREKPDRDPVHEIEQDPLHFHSGSMRLFPESAKLRGC